MYLYNILIFYLLIGVIVNYIFGINFSTLSCGIFAWVGKDTKFFRRDLFNILGMYNDSRGGDACGVYFDNNWYKGVGTSAKYEKLIVDYNLHNTLKLKQHPVIIGHDRKVSVGYLTIDNAQPVVLETEEQNICYVQAHNGTITNYRELAKRYNLTIEAGESDSIILAKLIDRVGWSILQEYEGSAALVMYNMEEPNVIYAFHGRSRATEHVALTDERPLAYITFPSKGTYISSDINHLGNLSMPSKKIVPYEFKYNVLYRLEGDSVVEMMEVDRTKINMPTPKKNYNIGAPFKSNKKSPLDYFENISSTTNVRYNTGLYLIDDEPAHGVYQLDNWGYLSTKLPFNPNVHFEVCFIYGVMMKDRLSFEIMSKFIEDNNIKSYTEFYNLENFNRYQALEILKKHAATPFWRYTQTGTFVGYIKPAICNSYDKYGGSHYFDGTYIFPLSRFQMRINYGDIIEVKEEKYLLTLGEFLKGSSGKHLNFSETSDEKLKLIDETISGKSKKESDTIAKDIANSYGYSLPPECETCNKWSTDYEYCSKKCPLYETIGDDDNHEMAVTTIKSSFKEVEDAIDTAIDVYESLSIDLKDDKVEEIIDSLKETKIKLISK